MSLFGSYFGSWNQINDFLRASIASPYDVANGKHGYGLTSMFPGFGNFGLSAGTLTARTLGACIGEALYTGYAGQVNYGLMGDPALRDHAVIPPSGVTVSKTATTATISWTASTDAGVSGYNVYRAPTRKGRFTLVNTGGPVVGTSHVASRPTGQEEPDNHYMVRAVKTETTPVGSYV